MTFTVVLDQAILSQIIQRIVDAVKPLKIVMFGSRARGDFRPDSDLDLIIVVNDDGESRRLLTQKIYRALWGILVPIDILVYRPDEIESRQDSRYDVVGYASREGRVIYEQ